MYCEPRLPVTETIPAVVIRHVDRYPPPPTAGFEVSLDVDTMWRRYLGYLSGRQPLLATAYFAFTMVVAAHDGRPQAAKRYNIDETVLSKLSHLSSTRRDDMSARKIKGKRQPLSSAEHTWFHETIPLLILQFGLSARSPAARRLSMADLPKL
jgi:hypothetical protein